MSPSSKILPLAVALLFPAGAMPHLHAQDGGTLTLAGSNTYTGTRVISSGTLTINNSTTTGATVQLNAFPHVYTGTVTQSNAAGSLGSGTFVLSVSKDGRLSASVVLEKVMTTYVGVLRRNANGVRRHVGNGYVALADSEHHKVPGTAKIPVVVDAEGVNGSIVDEAGTSTVFKGARSQFGPVLNLTNLGAFTPLNPANGTTGTGDILVISSGH